MKRFINTPRLILTDMKQEDAAAMFAYRKLPEVTRFQSFGPSSVEDVERFIETLEEGFLGSPGSWSQLAIRSKDNDRLIGDIGIHVLKTDSRQVEIGFTLDPSFQGNGFATEAVNAVINTLFEKENKHRIIASVDPENTKSIALLERLGMRKEAHFRQSLFLKGEWVDDVIYAILASEWTSTSS